MTSTVKIALPLPVDTLYSYKIETNKTVESLIGCRVIVPFGKRKITGVIVSEDSDVSADVKLKEVIELLDFEPSFDNSLLQLTKWIAGYYLCSWGEAFKAAIPSGMSPKSFLNIKLKNVLSGDEIKALAARSKKREKLLNYLNELSEPVSVNFIQKKLKITSVSEFLEPLLKKEIIELTGEMTTNTQKRTLKGLALSNEYLQDDSKLKELLDMTDAKAPKQSSLISYIFIKNNQGIIPTLSIVRNELKVTDSVVKSLVHKGILILEDVEIDRTLSPDVNGLAQRDESLLKLTDEQELCSEEIKIAIAESGFKTFLLHGVTGSGKTIVYINSIKEVLAKNKSALLLVPEISLTPQLIDRFRIVFGNQIVAVHSRMSDGERYDAWRLIRSGEKRIVIGARSAIFAPLQNLGLIIVDEEHESSYKQDSPAPRYNARDTAVMRAKLDNIPIVLGSATPSIESRYNADTGRYKLLEIKQRADNAILPQIMVVDRVNAQKSGQMMGQFSKVMLNEIEERLKKKEGVILFQNRRGYASFLECPDCGFVPMCKNCDVSLTYHKNRHQLRCHYCGYTIESFKACPACGHPELNEQGSGTQRIEDELFDILVNDGFSPVIQRVDLDSTMRKGSLRKIFQAFSNGEIDILVGTQMVAKGLDFERVTLVGVINADLQLFLPDFRASERTYQLLTQVSGRSGRSGSKPGEVIIQTSHPNNAAIKAAVSNSFETFYLNELENRKRLNYPPFVRFIHIEFSSKDEKKVDEIASVYYKLIPQHDSIEKLGPSIPVIPKLMNNYRRYIIIKSSKMKDSSGRIMRDIIKYVHHLYNSKHSTASVRVTVNVDSFNSL